MVRGSKHWPYDMVASMWAWVVPLIRTALEKITVETIVDWGTCFATASESRDPTSIHWMMEVLMEEPIRLNFDSYLSLVPLTSGNTGFCTIKHYGEICGVI